MGRSSKVIWMVFDLVWSLCGLSQWEGEGWVCCTLFSPRWGYGQQFWWCPMGRGVYESQTMMGWPWENATRQMMSDGREPQESGIAGYTGCTSRNLSCSKKLLIIVMSLWCCACPKVWSLLVSIECRWLRYRMHFQRERERGCVGSPTYPVIVGEYPNVLRVKPKRWLVKSYVIPLVWKCHFL